MAKKSNEIKKLSPGGCLESLRFFNEAVLFLSVTVDTVVQHIEPQLRDALKGANDKVKEFYQTEN